MTEASESEFEIRPGGRVCAGELSWTLVDADEGPEGELDLDDVSARRRAEPFRPVLRRGVSRGHLITSPPTRVDVPLDARQGE